MGADTSPGKAPTIEISLRVWGAEKKLGTTVNFLMFSNFWEACLGSIRWKIKGSKCVGIPTTQIVFSLDKVLVCLKSNSCSIAADSQVALIWAFWSFLPLWVPSTKLHTQKTPLELESEWSHSDSHRKVVSRHSRAYMSKCCPDWSDCATDCVLIANMI